MKTVTTEGEIHFEPSDVRELRDIRSQTSAAVEVSLDLGPRGNVLGLMPAADFEALIPRVEEIWRAEFEQRGRQAIRDAMHGEQGIYPDPKRLLAIKWLREKEIAAERRADNAYWYVKWSWDAALAAAVIASIALVVMLLKD